MAGASLNGLANINVELTSRCNKNCWMCGRRKVEREYPDLTLAYGDMDFALVERIAAQVPAGIVVQLHNNGEALLYPRFGDAVSLFRESMTNVVSNGKLLVAKADEIIDNLDTLAVSVFENDDEADEQFDILVEFLRLKGNRKPHTILRINGDMETAKYESLGLVLARRALHSPMGSFNYRRAEPTVPEIGVCLDFLHHLAINKDGEASICVRFDPERLGVIGDTKTETLIDIWNSPRRLEWLAKHWSGQRSSVPLCSRCHFWGVPTAPFRPLVQET